MKRLLIAFWFLALLPLGAVAAVTTSPGKSIVKAAAGVVSAKSAAVHPAGTTKPHVVAFIRPLERGMEGCPCPTVFQLQRALKAAHVRPASSRATGYFGEATQAQVKAFQKRVHISQTGKYGKPTHLKLSRYYDQAGRSRLTQVAASRKIVAISNAITNVTTHATLVGGNTLTYSQSANTRSILPAYPRLPPATDCSGYVTWVYQSVGLADPSGWAFHPAGWTGSLARRGIVVSAYTAKIGDLVFYGGGPPFGHVAIVARLHPTRVSTHGHRGVQLEPITYRPVSQVRRYY